MSTTTNPLIAQKLEAFGARWRWLVLWRGICGGIITLLGAMTLVAFIDLLVILPDGVRWGMSAAGYVVTLGVVWFVCVRRLFRAPGTRELARLVERAEPGLREDLLSAVELGEGKAEPQWDSEVFRELLQQDVARRVRLLEMESILPRQLISFWLKTAAIAVAVCAVLFLVPGLHYDRLMVRAFAPMANVERVSRVKIRIVEPRASDKWQPLGDNLPIVVEISGPEPDKVVLESFSPKGGHEKTTMGLVGLRQYSAAVPLGVEGMEFRVRAGDAITKRIAIQTRPRPHVVKFDKTFHYPDYTLMQPRHEVGENGDLSELEGTEVELKLQVNQAIKEGELLLEQDGKTNRLALTTAGPNQMAARFPLLKSGTYQVRLVAAETGFENKFSPMYEMHPLPDLVPHVGIDSPKQDLIVPPEEVVHFQGSANDDIGLARIIQLVQVNDGAWSEVPLLQEPRTNAVVTRKWDMLQQGVSPGDRVATKLLAIDLKGNRSESALIHLVISSVGLDAKRLRLLEAKRGLRESLITVGNSAVKLRSGMSNDTANQVKKGNELQTKQLLLSALGTAQDLEQQAEKSWDQLKDVIKLARPGRDAADLAVLGRALSVMRQESLPVVKAEIEIAVKEADEAGGDIKLKQAIQTAQRMADQAGTLQNSFTDILASDEVDAITENLSYLGREQERMHRQAATDAKQDASVWLRLARREAGAAKEAQVVEEMLKALALHVPKVNAERISKARGLIATNRLSLEKSLEGRVDKEVVAVTQKMQKGVDSGTAEMRPIGRDLALRADKGRDALLKLAGTSFAKVERLRRDVDELADTEKKLADPRRKDPKLEVKAKETRERVITDWKSAVEQLKDRAGIEEARRDADPFFVSDATKSAQALNSLRAAAGEQTSRMAEPIKEIEKAFQLLEGGHSLSEVASSVKSIAQQERWEIHTMESLTTRPRDWNWLSARLQGTPAELKKALLPERVVMKVNDAARSPMTQDLDREMAGRLTQKELIAMPDRAEKLHAALMEALAEVGPLMTEARATVTTAAPKLAEMMAGLAQSTAELEKETRDTSKSPKEVTDESRRLEEKQRELNKQLGELMEAIRRDANIQDMAKADQRERARDADDAVAMLREPPVKALEALREAAEGKESVPQKTSLTDAADQQKKLEESLKQLARHYQKMDSGTPGETRQALRQAEEELGIKTALNEQYDMAEKLAEMDSKSPQQMLEELEKELAHNETMRAELNNIARDTLESARDMLDRAVRTEKGLAKAIADAAQGQEQVNSLAAELRDIGRQAKQMAERDVAAINQQAVSAAANADAELERAKNALESAGRDTEPAASGAALASQMADLKKQLELAKAELQAAAAKAAKAGPNDSAREAQAGATKAADQSEQLAQRAQKIADALKALPEISAGEAIAEAGAYQAAVIKGVDGAGSGIERSGRHESRMGTPQGERLQVVGSETQQAAEKNLQATEKALTGGQKENAADGSSEKAKEMAKNSGNESAQDASQKQDRQSGNQKSSGDQSQQKSDSGKQDSQQNSKPDSKQDAKQSGKSKDDSGGKQSPGGSGKQAAQASSQSGQPASVQPNSSGNNATTPATKATPESAQAALNAAQQTVDFHLNRLNETLAQPLVPPPAAQAPSVLEAIVAMTSPAQSKWMARTLDELDAAMHAKQNGENAEQGEQEGKDGKDGKAGKPSGAKEAAKQAAQAQKNAMMAQRTKNGVPGEKQDSQSEGDGNGDPEALGGLPPGALPQVKGLREGDWGRLPPKLAQGLMDAQREGMVGEYRNQVQTYFRVVADKAREKKP